MEPRSGEPRASAAGAEVVPATRPSGGWWLKGLITLAVLQVGVLAWSRLEGDTGESAPAGELAVGAAFPRLEVSDLDGNPVTLDPEDFEPCTVLIFFAPECPYCTESAPHWRTDFGAGAGRTAIGIAYASPDAAAAYVDAHDLAFPVYAERTAQLTLHRVTGVLSVPTLVQLGGDGTVRHVVKGGPYPRSELEQIDACDG